MRIHITKQGKRTRKSFRPNRLATFFSLSCFVFIFSVPSGFVKLNLPSYSSGEQPLDARDQDRGKSVVRTRRDGARWSKKPYKTRGECLKIKRKTSTSHAAFLTWLTEFFFSFLVIKSSRQRGEGCRQTYKYVTCTRVLRNFTGKQWRCN